jgi:hypothetical protein
MSTHAAINGQPVKNNSGSAINVGSSSRILVGKSLSDSATALGVVGSVVVDGTDTDKAVSANTFAKNTSKPLAIRLDAPLNKASSSVRRAIHKIEGVSTRRVATAIRAGNYNIYTGLFSVAPTVGSDNFGQDDAATPTAAVPGELTYRTGADKPVNADYKAKTN